MNGKLMNSFHFRLALITPIVVACFLIIVGYVVTPVLFQQLPAKQAGAVASELFVYVAVVCLVSFSILAFQSCRHQQSLAQRWHWLLSIIIMSLLLFGLSPWMADIKATYPQGISHDSTDWKLFATLHGFYQLGYLMVLVLTLYGFYKTWRFQGFSDKA